MILSPLGVGSPFDELLEHRTASGADFAAVAFRSPVPPLLVRSGGFVGHLVDVVGPAETPPLKSINFLQKITIRLRDGGKKS